MRSGVSYPSWTSTAAFAVTTGAAAASYPITNLSDLKRVRRVARSNTSASMAFTFTLTAAQAVQFMALCRHNASSTETVRIRLFSDANPDPVGNVAHQVYDSAAVAAPAIVAGYPQLWPFYLTNPVTARSGHVLLSSRAATDGLAWEIGGFEVSGWWQWTDVAIGRQRGFNSGARGTEVAAGVKHVTTTWSPRTLVGSRRVVDQSEIETTALDFMKEKGRWNPFVWAWDVDDATTWAREAMLVRNTMTRPSTITDPFAGRVDFEFEEHL